ncbi:MAG: carbohydrate ABC transporter permease [Actinomycetota bacterium]|nr:carbohydrate ABC transporter permease [Actinomycetota bacterium]
MSTAPQAVALPAAGIEDAPARRRPRLGHRAKRRLSGTVAFVLGTIWLIIVLAPIYFMVLSSLRTQGTYVTANPWVPTGGLTGSEYSTVFHAGLGGYFVNSVIVTVACVLITLALSLAASFRIIRRTSRLSGAVMRLLVFGLAVPIQALIVPLYIIIDKIGLYDTLSALVLTMSAAAIPVSVLIMLSFVRDIPRELIDAMSVDGAGEWRIFASLIVPLSRPVLATVAIYNGLNVWNNFLLPLVLTQSNSNAVLPLGLFKFQGEYGIDVPAIMAAVLLSVIPLVILYIAMRRQFVRGLSGVAMR